MQKPVIPFSAIAARRAKLINLIGDALLILPAAPEQVRNRDCNFIFRQDSDFWYLSHFNEPESIIVLDGKNKQSILFSMPYDEQYAIWEGEIIGQARACSDYLFDKSQPIKNFESYLTKACTTVKTLYYPWGRYKLFDSSIFDIVDKSRKIRRAKVIQNLYHSDQVIHPLRHIKDKHEIAMMQYAADISAHTHSEVMRQVTHFDNEMQIKSLLDFNYSYKGGFPAYQHIVAGGNNACVLHYTENNKSLNKKDLILIDSGCEIEGYAADITRTIPASGKFSPEQKKLYNHVLDALDLAIKAVKAGVNIDTPHEVARDRLIEGMLDLGLVKGDLNSVIKDKSYTKYFMHGTSHWLGIDVHDVGDYTDETESPTQLKENMVITVEPGLYIREDDESAPKTLRGIGIRIEDNLVVTKEGSINLTKKVPKTVEAIEALCRQ